MMGSMGTVVGEKVTRLFEYASRAFAAGSGVHGFWRCPDAGRDFLSDADGKN